jgi:hypothetical protein
MNLLYFLGLITYTYAISSGANEPIADNELQLIAKDCALQYCKTKNGYELWVALQKRCKERPNPY